MLNLETVSVAYDGRDVVKDVSLCVHAGESLAIIGSNGSGKTSLLSAMANLIPFRGEICLDGQSIRAMPRLALARCIAMLGQVAEVYFSYSVFDAVLMGRYPHRERGLLGRYSEADRAATADCIRMVGLSGLESRSVATLSGGERQRVFLAQVFAQDPAIILLDEPTNHLDLTYQIELIDYLNHWRGQNSRAVVGVLHDVNLAMRLSDRLLLLKDGAIFADAKADEAVAAGLFDAVFDTDVGQYMQASLMRWRDVFGDR